MVSHDAQFGSSDHKKVCFPRLQGPVVVVKGVNSWELFVVVLARGQQGTPHPVACLKRTNSGTFP
ncbi:TPA: hypothetical protein ACH3X1_004129 [Trebouxia sp. C0004]